MPFAWIVVLAMLAPTLEARATSCANSGRRGSLSEMQDFGCQLGIMSADCRSFFYENPDLLEFAKDCDNPNDQRPRLIRWSEACKDAGISAWTEVWKQLNTAGKAIDACDANPACKSAVAVDAYFVCRDKQGRNLFPCTDAAQLAEVDVRDLLRKRDHVREMAKRDTAYRTELLGKGVPLPDGDDGPPLEALVSSSLEGLGVRAQCFNGAGYARMGCYALASVADPTLIVAGAPLGTLKGAKWLMAVLRGARIERSAAEVTTALAEKTATRAITLTRLEGAWGKSLSPADRQAIEAAHRIGDGEPGLDGTAARIGNYTQGQLRRKYKALKDRFSPSQIRDLVENGVVGADAKTDDVLNAFQNTETQSLALKKSIPESTAGLKNLREFQSFEKQIDDLEKKQQAIFHDWDPASPTSTTNAQIELAKVQAKLTKAREESLLWQKRAAMNWATVRNEPQAMLPNHVYAVQTERGPTIKVSFSKDVVDQVMWNHRDDFSKKISASFVEAISRGVTRGDSVGITTMSLDGHKLVKVHLIGRTTGTYRLYGFEENGVYHFVHWENESNHNATYLQRALRNTQRAFETYQRTH